MIVSFIEMKYIMGGGKFDLHYSFIIVYCVQPTKISHMMSEVVKKDTLSCKDVRYLDILENELKFHLVSTIVSRFS